ncbi:hypothetical protein KIW84_033506 [Lathyrus oleraceus]|uniref:Uncharacterized protein n=1 Tax=Pisum sativum TaxID=3888 RepID=A0A9D5B011_PEA|nr:hypothetical protein KIW84_033506 [Pisum sativum]
MHDSKKFPTYFFIRVPIIHITFKILFHIQEIRDATENSPDNGNTDEILSHLTGGSLNLDGHNGKILKVSIYPYVCKVQVAASFDSNGLLLFWSLSNISNDILGCPTLVPTCSLVKGACGVGLEFWCQDLVTRVEAADDSTVKKETEKEYHEFSNGPTVLRAYLRIATHLPFIVSQAGDGNHFGGYWLDLAQAENNKQWHNLEELYLAPGTNLDLLLVGGPEP